LFVYNASGQIVSQLRWGPQAPDLSIGRQGGSWQLLTAPTRGFANAAAAALGSATTLRINEWSSAGTVEWFELYNLDAGPVALAGLFLSDDPSEVGRKKYLVPPLSFIGGNGWTVFTADSNAALGASHTNFGLASTGEYLRLSAGDTSASLIDAVSFGSQTASNSGGRIADGTATISNALTPTPGSRNALAATTVPVIISQSGNATVFQGNAINLTVSAAGPALSYEWTKNGVPMGGATSATLALGNVSVDDSATYGCIVSNGNGSDMSRPMVLTVIRSFAQWSASFGIADATPDGDADGDGISNLAEFFHNTDPSSATGDRSGLPQVGVEPPFGPPTYLTLTYRRNAALSISDIAHELSAALGSSPWTTRQPDVVENLAPDPVTRDPRVRMKFLVAPGEVNKFIRLELTP
jgi:hypothetical protein